MCGCPPPVGVCPLPVFFLPPRRDVRPTQDEQREEMVSFLYSQSRPSVLNPYLFTPAGSLHVFIR